MSHVCALRVPGHDKCAIAASALVGASGVYLGAFVSSEDSIDKADVQTLTMWRIDFILLILASANALNLWIAAASTTGCSASLRAYSAL